MLAATRRTLLWQVLPSASVLASVPWVAQWRFNNNGNDSIGANNLTNNNSATFTTGKLGGATGATQLVRASSQYWSVANNAAFSPTTQDFYVAAWVYADSHTTTHQFSNAIAAKWNGAGGSGQRAWALYYDHDDFTPNDRMVFIVSSNGSNLSGLCAATFGALSLSTWYLVESYFDSVHQTLGIAVNNGAFDTVSFVSSIFNSTSPFTAGQFNGLSVTNWDGRIDNIVIAKGAGAILSAAQRSALWNGGAGSESITQAVALRREYMNWLKNLLKRPRVVLADWQEELQRGEWAYRNGVLRPVGAN